MEALTFMTLIVPEGINSFRTILQYAIYPFKSSSCHCLFGIDTAGATAYNVFKKLPIVTK